MSVKVQYVISDDAMEVINSAASERKRGDWISKAVLEYSRIVTGLPAQSDDNGLLERVDSRLANVERQLAVLIQKAQS